MTAEDREKLVQAINLIESTDEHASAGGDYDVLVVRAVLDLKDAVAGKRWVS